jgi:hypothetical protein
MERRGAMRPAIRVYDERCLMRASGQRDPIGQIEVWFERAQTLSGVDLFAAGNTITLSMLEQLFGPGGNR